MSNPLPETTAAIEPERLAAAYEKARLELLDRRSPDGHWIGHLADSALATATAVSALTLVERRRLTADPSTHSAEAANDSQLSELIANGIRWLARAQNQDGGWGDTDKSYSNVATTMLAVAAFHLTGVPAKHEDLLVRAEEYLERQGHTAGLRRRYGRDKTFAVPILTNCALAGRVDWRQVPPLPFELACFPQEFYRFLQLPVVSYAIPALVAIGQARFHHRKPFNPVTRLIRRMAVDHSLRVLDRMQPASGGYLEAVPLTSFVVMSLASIGRVDHPIVRRGVDFLVRSVRPAGCWPIDTNLATWNTTLSLNAFAGAGEEIAELASLEWLLDCQFLERHVYTGAAPGGWGWSDLSGAVPDADDTAGALLALAAWRRSVSCSGMVQRRIDKSARLGLRWLLDIQNSDGGWPTFCRGWGKLPFDRSGADLTAHALRALSSWGGDFDDMRSATDAACRRGLRYLARVQQPDGGWPALWFGNQDHPREENPIYGTSRVLAAFRDLGCSECSAAQRGLKMLLENQNRDGGWGGGPALERIFGSDHHSSVEETALALEALITTPATAPWDRPTTDGLNWLIAAVESDRYRETSPIGFYFAKLWYHEQLYPIIFTVAALGQALRRLPAASGRYPATSRLTG